MSFAASDIQELKQRADIVDVISSFADVRRSGAAYVCRCPWHDDRKPSLSIDTRRQLWRCWVCDIGGDAIAFLMRSGMTFVDAIQYLADRVGYTLKPTGDTKPRESKLHLYQAMDQVARYYRSQYAGSPAEAYAESRGIGREVAERYGLGYAPDVFRALSRSGVDDERLIQIGVARRTERGSFYDLLRHRWVIPIHDVTGRCVSVSGRDLSGTDPKYINGAASQLFDKSSTLFGFHQARQSIRKLNEAVVVEGFTDVIALACAGVENVIGVMGTAFTSQHLRLLTPLCDRVVLLLDGDGAGVKKANQLIELFVSADVDLRVGVIPDGKDPDEFIRSDGTDALRSVICGAKDAIEYRMSVAFQGVVSNEPGRVAAAIDEMVPLLRSMTDSVRRDLVISTLSRWCNVTADAVNAQVRNQLKRHDAKPTPRAEPSEKLTEREVTLFACMMTSEAALSICLGYIVLKHMSAAGLRLYSLFGRVEALGNGTPFDALMAGCADDPDLQSLVVSLTDRHVDPKHAESIGCQTLNRINADAIQRSKRNQPLETVLAERNKR